MKNCIKKSIKNSNGITLIALVITIIVLLILAGISISMLSGENGILQKATDAKTQTGIGQEKETVALAYNSALAKKVGNGNSSAVTYSELNDELDSSEATASGNPIIVTFTKSGNAYEIDSNGIIKPSTPKDPNASNLTVAELNAIEANNTANPTDQIEEITSSVTNTNLQNTTKIKAVLTGDVPIPVGANYLEGTVDTGVVIEYKGSEFVWVPVPEAVYDGTKDNTLPKTSSTGSLTEGHGYTPMAINTGTSENPVYKGLIYVYDATNGAYLLYTNAESNYQGASSMYREPATLSLYDIDSEQYLSEIGLNENSFTTEIQTYYDNMVESVAKYGGFYVGRYETSINGSTVASISGVKAMTAENSSGNKWYGMYDKQKKFTEDSDKMQAGMIWGSQYDAMLNWALKGADKEKVNSTGNSNCNGQQPNTGEESRDVINNIYDLEGNQLEWTQEASGNNCRRYRGRCIHL